MCFFFKSFFDPADWASSFSKNMQGGWTSQKTFRVPWSSAQETLEQLYESAWIPTASITWFKYVASHVENSHFKFINFILSMAASSFVYQNIVHLSQNTTNPSKIPSICLENIFAVQNIMYLPNSFEYFWFGCLFHLLTEEWTSFSENSFESPSWANKSSVAGNGCYDFFVTSLSLEKVHT